MSGHTPTQAPQNMVISASVSFTEALPHLLPYLPDGTRTHPADLKRLEFMWPELATRAQTLPEVAAAARYLLADVTQDYTAEHTAILLEAHHLLHEVYDTFSAVTEWTPDILHRVIANLVERHGGDFKTAGRPLRVALTAQLGGPDMSRIMAALGQNECLRRLKAALHHVHENGGHHH